MRWGNARFKGGKLSEGKMGDGERKGGKRMKGKGHVGGSWWCMSDCGGGWFAGYK